MDNHLEQKSKELSTIEAKLKKANQEYEPYKAQEELDMIHELLPMVKEQQRLQLTNKKRGCFATSPSSAYSLSVTRSKLIIF